jgi:hypothetical protein
MERDRLTPMLIMTTGLQHPEVPQAATDAYAVTRGRTAWSSHIGETCKGDPSLTLTHKSQSTERLKDVYLAKGHLH